MRGRLDKATVVGLLTAVGCIVGGHMLEGGHPGSILQLTAALIVFGGTLGAVLVSFSLRDISAAFKAIRGVFFDPGHNPAALVSEIVALGQTARVKGLLALEGEIGRASTPFLATALRLAVDGTDPKLVREVLETTIAAEGDVARRHARIFSLAGGYAPTVGILGAVLGLIHVMENLTDPARMGGGIATAFVATVYGVAFANLFCLPAANKLRLRHEEAEVGRVLVLEGVLAVQLGENPRLIEERLRSFLPGLASGYKPFAADRAA